MRKTGILRGPDEKGEGNTDWSSVAALLYIVRSHGGFKLCYEEDRHSECLLQ